MPTFVIMKNDTPVRIHIGEEKEAEASMERLAHRDFCQQVRRYPTEWNGYQGGGANPGRLTYREAVYWRVREVRGTEDEAPSLDTPLREVFVEWRYDPQTCAWRGPGINHWQGQCLKWPARLTITRSRNIVVAGDGFKGSSGFITPNKPFSLMPTSLDHAAFIEGKLLVAEEAEVLEGFHGAVDADALKRYRVARAQMVAHGCSEENASKVFSILVDSKEIPE